MLLSAVSQTISPTSMVTGGVAEYVYSVVLYVVQQENIREAKNLLLFGKKLYFPSTSIVTSTMLQLFHSNVEASHWDNIPRGFHTWVDYIHYFTKCLICKRRISHQGSHRIHYCHSCRKMRMLRSTSRRLLGSGSLIHVA